MKANNSYTVVIQLLSHVWLFATPWMIACQAPLSSTVSQCLLTFTSIESMVLCHHLILCHPLHLLPSVFSSIRFFPVSQLFASGGLSIGASAYVLPMNIQGWFPLGLTGLISLLSKGLSRVFSTTAIWNHPFFSMVQLSYGVGPTLWSIKPNFHIYTWLPEKP